MTAARTPSQRGAANRRKGAVAERDLCRWLRANGYPTAERGVVTGFRTAERAGEDPGDVRGTPICWSVKDCRTERLSAWLAELDAMAAPLGTPRLLVQKRAGHADSARWWCWTRLGLLLAVCTVAPPALKGPVLAAIVDGSPQPVRMELGHVVPLLRAAGYGEPLPYRPATWLTRLGQRGSRPLS